MKKLKLIIEKGEDKKLWGRVEYDDDLITASGSTFTGLERSMRKALKDFHSLDKVVFDHRYDLTVFFEKFKYFKQSELAIISGINPGLLRQYASGVKHPSATQAKKIEDAIHALAKELNRVSIFAE